MINVSLPTVHVPKRQDCQDLGLRTVRLRQVCQESYCPVCQGPSGLSGTVDNPDKPVVSVIDHSPSSQRKSVIMGYANINRSSLTFVHFLTILIAYTRKDQVPFCIFLSIINLVFLIFSLDAILVRIVVMDSL